MPSPPHFPATPARGRSHQQLGFESFISEVDESHGEFKQSQKDRQRNQPNTNGMTPEELQALQEKLFSQSQARLQSGGE